MFAKQMFAQLGTGIREVKALRRETRYNTFTLRL